MSSVDGEPVRLGTAAILSRAAGEGDQPWLVAGAASTIGAGGRPLPSPSPPPSPAMREKEGAEALNAELLPRDAVEDEAWLVYACCGIDLPASPPPSSPAQRGRGTSQRLVEGAAASTDAGRRPLPSPSAPPSPALREKEEQEHFAMRASILTQKRARSLRRSMTQPEKLLWSLLRRDQQGPHFRRQHAVGPYILDFYCATARLCVEIDGPAHADQVAHDEGRTRWLADQGIRVTRFSVDDVEARPAAVVAAIVRAAAPSTAAPSTA